MPRGILAGRSPVGRGEARGELGDERADGARRVLGLARGAHEARADDHAVGARVGRLRAPARAC